MLSLCTAVLEPLESVLREMSSVPAVYAAVLQGCIGDSAGVRMPVCVLAAGQQCRCAELSTAPVLKPPLNAHAKINFTRWSECAYGN